jgi:hypothetical protein
LRAISQERDQDVVGFDPLIGLVVDRPDRQIMLQFLERLLDIPLKTPLIS